jgi:hypothetical protein
MRDRLHLDRLTTSYKFRQRASVGYRPFQQMTDLMQDRVFGVSPEIPHAPQTSTSALILARGGYLGLCNKVQFHLICLFLVILNKRVLLQ